MDIQQKNHHYIHSIEHPHSQRTIIKSFHVFQKQGHSLQIAIVNHNTIQIYRNVGSSVVYDRTHHFMCDISVLEVIPVKGQADDVLFMADQLGRYMFWSPAQGILSANNTVRAPQYLAPFYQKAPIQQKQPQFSGVSFNFNIFDTQAIIFFTVSTKINILKIRWTKGKILHLVPPIQITCPYLDVNYIGIIGGKDPYIGIVQQRQQKTFLRFHKPNSQNFECSLTLQKSNLTSFYSSPQGQQIITVTNSQLSIYNTKSQQVFCSFQISESGFVCGLDHELYLYVGQLGSQMIVFNKKHYKNYGSFMLQNQVCMRLSTHGKLSDGGFLVSVIDQGHTVQFISLYQESWKSIRSIFSTSSIFSVQDLERPHQCLAVVRVGQNIHQIGILSNKISSKLQKQTLVRSPILSLFSSNNGKAIIVSNNQSNSVMIYSQQHDCFEQGFQFQVGVIIKVLDKYIVMENKIYQMDINSTKNHIKQILVEKGGIISADFDGKFLGYQCKDLNYKFFNLQTKQIDRIRKNCFQQYIWKFQKSQTLVVGCLNLPGKLKIVPVFRQGTVVQTGCNEIIVDIINYGQLMLISFSNCKIHIYQFNSMKVINVLDFSSQPLQLIKCKNNIFGFGVNQSYFINTSTFQCEQIQFDPSKEIVNLIYLDDYNKFVLSHQQSLALYSVSYDKPEQASSFRVVSMNIDANLPFATYRNGCVYVAQNYETIMRKVTTAQLIKKQSHGLKQICCVQQLKMGLLVCGINDMDSAQILIFDYKDLEILCTEILHKNQSFEKKVPTAVIKKDDNSFFLREDNSITLYEIKNNNLREIFSSKTGLNGYTLSIQPQLSMIMASDPLRYLVVYDYRLGKLISLCRHQILNTINDIQFLQSSVILGDNVGNISIVQFNFDKAQVLRTTMTQVGSLKIGSQIFYITKGNEGVIYSTVSGSIGRIRTIDEQKFTILKEAQKQAIKILQQNKGGLRYQEWVNRNCLNDKLIDGFLIQQYLLNKNVKDNNYETVKQLWHEHIKLK